MAGRKRRTPEAGSAAKRGAVGAPSERATLTRAAVLAAALRIADTEGLPALTIRKLATAVGVTPMAVYRHCRNKAEITDGILDLVVGQSAPTRHDSRDWAEWLRITLRIMRRALRAHPGVIPLLGTPAGFGPNALRVMNDMLSVLRGAGLPNERAVQAVYVLISYTVGGAAIVNAARRPGRGASRIETGRWFRQAVERFEGDAASELPALVALSSKLGEFASDEQFHHGLAQLIAALGAEIRCKR
jgi:AcrR family transcriptional regulator